MNYQHHLAQCAIISLCAIGSSPAQAFEDRPFAFDLHDKDQPFEPGHSCAELSYLTDVELKEALSPAFQSDFHAFCHPEEPEACGDYTASLRGMGRLAQGDDGYHCRFLPADAR